MKRVAGALASLLVLLLTGCPSLPPPERLQFDTDPRILRGNYLGSVDTRLAPGWMALAGDGSLLALSWNDRVEFWDVGASGMLASAPLPTDGYSGLGALDVNRDGSVVAGVLRGNVLSWDGRDGALLGEFDPGAAFGDCLYCGAHEVAIDPDGATLAVAGQSPTVLVVNAVTGTMQRELETAGHAVGMIDFSADGALLAAGSHVSDTGYALRVWDTASYEVVFERQGTVAHSRVPRFAFSADGGHIAVGGEEKVEVFDLAGGKTTLPLAENRWFWTLSPDGTKAIVDAPGERGADLDIVEVSTGTAIASFSDVQRGYPVWSDDGRYLIAGAALFDGASYEPVRDFLSGALHSLELEAAPTYLDAVSYSVTGTIRIDGGDVIEFDGTVEGNESQRYLGPQARAPYPATLEIALHGHPWRLHAWQDHIEYSRHLEPLEPGVWTGNVTNAGGGDDQAWHPLELWPAPAAARAGPPPSPFSTRAGPLTSPSSRAGPLPSVSGAVID